MNVVIIEAKMTANLVILQTNGYELKFYLNSLENYLDNIFDAEIEFLVRSEFSQKVSVKSGVIQINIENLTRLINYLKNHMNIIQINPEQDSYTFTDYSLGYQIQALCGFISPIMEESYFSIISMVNIGKSNSLSDSTYIGGESTISFKQAETFIQSLEKFISSQ